MSTEQNKAVVRGMVDALNSAAWRERILPFIKQDAMADEFLRSHTLFRKAFPDYDYTLEEMVAEGDRVVTVGTVRGTHTAEYPEAELKGVAATGKKLEWREVAMYRLAGGAIVDGWLVVDGVTRLQQLGVLK